MTTLSQNALIEEACLRHSQRCATLTPDDQRLTFEVLLETIKSFTVKLRENGVVPGQRVIPFSENPAVFHGLVLALLRVGATAVIYPSADLAASHGLKIDAAITLADAPSKLLPNITFDQSWFGAEGSDEIGPDGNFILSSSGTTGEPKYYLAPQAIMKNWGDARASMYDATDTDTLATLPPATSYCMWMAMQATMIGGAILRPRATARATLEGLKPELPLDIMTTPAILAEFLTAVEDGVPVPENLRAILLGGSTVSRHLAQRAEELLGCNIYNAFGSIETGGNTLARPATQDFEQGVIGTPFPWVDFNIESEDGSKLPLGEEGLLAVRVPPDCRILETLVGEHPYDKDGWFRSGDLGYELADGTLIFTGRKSATCMSASSWAMNETELLDSTAASRKNRILEKI